MECTTGSVFERAKDYSVFAQFATTGMTLE